MFCFIQERILDQVLLLHPYDAVTGHFCIRQGEKPGQFRRPEHHFPVPFLPQVKVVDRLLLLPLSIQHLQGRVVVQNHLQMKHCESEHHYAENQSQEIPHYCEYQCCFSKQVLLVGHFREERDGLVYSGAVEGQKGDESECGVEEGLHEVSSVIVTDAGKKPGTMVVHSQNAALALGAVMAALGLEDVANQTVLLFAVFSLSHVETPKDLGASWLHHNGGHHGPDEHEDQDVNEGQVEVGKRKEIEFSNPTLEDQDVVAHQGEDCDERKVTLLWEVATHYK